MTLLEVRSYPRCRNCNGARTLARVPGTLAASDAIHSAAGTSPDCDPAELRVLRAKYFDWCSARVAERFVSLGVEQIYELAGMAGRSGVPFQEVVDRATEALAAEMSLPSFDDWVSGYRANPQKYEEDLAGFWREHI